MREKLIELLKKTPISKIYGHIAEADVCFMPHVFESFADHLIANGVTVTDNNVGCKWIPVTERLPEYDQVVLCYKKDRGVRIGKHMAATFADGVEAFKDLSRDYAFGATHWMPLPEPPKGE